MAHPIIYGPALSTYVWSARLALAEKGVTHELVEMPFGAHRVPMRPDADLSLRGIGRIVFTGSAEIGRSVAVRAAERSLAFLKSADLAAPLSTGPPEERGRA